MRNFRGPMLGGFGMSLMPRGFTQPRHVARRDADDLAEAERDDGQVVAPQSQRRCAEQQAGDEGEHDGDGDGGQVGQRGVLRAEQPRGIGADGEEADVAEVEQAGLADHDVEAEADHGVGGGDEQDAAEVGVGRAEQRWLDDGEQEEEGDGGEAEEPAHRTRARAPPAGQGVAPVGAALAQAGRGRVGAHTRALPRDSPRSPVGRTISTTTSVTYAMTSRHCEPKMAEP